MSMGTEFVQQHTNICILQGNIVGGVRFKKNENGIPYSDALIESKRVGYNKAGPAEFSTRTLVRAFGKRVALFENLEQGDLIHCKGICEASCSIVESGGEKSYMWTNHVTVDHLVVLSKTSRPKAQIRKIVGKKRICHDPVSAI